MNLSFNQLKKREVINVAEGKSLGYITDLTISFPTGVLVGITVPGNKMNCILGLFNKSELYIPAKKILKIGNDVILVNLNCGDKCSENVDVNKKPKPFNPCNPCDSFSQNVTGGLDGSSFDSDDL